MNGLEMMRSLEAGKKADIVICALKNADTDGALLGLLKENPDRILQGIDLVAERAEAKEKILYLPEFAADLAEELQEQAQMHHVQICIGIVDVRAQKKNLIFSMDAAADLTDMHDNVYKEGIYVSFSNEGLKKWSEPELTERLQQSADAKSVCIGWNYYDPKALADLDMKNCNFENGVVSVLRDTDCIVADVEQKIEKAVRQSCGKCVFCREGLLQFWFMLKEIRQGRGKEEYLDLMQEIADAMTFSTECTMGQYTPELVLDSLNLLREEYRLHIKKKECPAGICFSKEVIYIDPKKCAGCGDCMDVCEKDCIEGKNKYIHMIDEFECDRCGKCMENCPEDAIVKTSGKVPKLPNRLTKVGKFKR